MIELYVFGCLLVIVIIWNILIYSLAIFKISLSIIFEIIYKIFKFVKYENTKYN
jgi:hypothetical protein